LSTNLGKPPDEWRNHSTKHPLAAARLKQGDLKRLYRLINDKQFEYRDRFMPVLVQQSNETSQQFQDRQTRVYKSFVTSATIATSSGVMLTGNEEAFLDPVSLPENIRSVLFSTRSPLLPLGLTPACSIVLFLDFTLPPPFDFTRLPTLATQNESNFEIAADNESWFASSNAGLVEFFKNRTRHTNWLHGGGTYDALLFLLGVPLALWFEYHLAQWVEPIAAWPSFIKFAFYVYTFLLALNLFRIFFSYSRWVFPKVELETDRPSSPFRHRTIWGLFLVPVVAALIYDVIKLLPFP